jgi:hypothetical protein
MAPWDVGPLPRDGAPSKREVPLRPSPPLLLAKALQHLEVQPDLPAPPLLGLAQPSARFLGDLGLHP